MIGESCPARDPGGVLRHDFESRMISLRQEENNNGSSTALEVEMDLMGEGGRGIVELAGGHIRSTDGCVEQNILPYWNDRWNSSRGSIFGTICQTLSEQIRLLSITDFEKRTM
jgi:hypothetical protein